MYYVLNFRERTNDHHPAKTWRDIERTSRVKREEKKEEMKDKGKKNVIRDEIARENTQVSNE